MTAEAHPPVIPSGEQIELAHGDQHAAVVEVGGALRSYSVAGQQLLDGYSADERCTSARGQSLTSRAENRVRACPYGAGSHPCLSLGTEKIDPLQLQAPGESTTSAWGIARG